MLASSRIWLRTFCQYHFFSSKFNVIQNDFCILVIKYSILRFIFISFMCILEIWQKNEYIFLFELIYYLPCLSSFLIKNSYPTSYWLSSVHAWNITQFYCIDIKNVEQQQSIYYPNIARNKFSLWNWLLFSRVLKWILFRFELHYL